MSGLAHGSYDNPCDDADEVYTEADLFGGEFGQQLKLPFSCSKFKMDSFTFDPSEVTKSQLEPLHWIGLTRDNDADAFHGAALLGITSRDVNTHYLQQHLARLGAGGRKGGMAASGPTRTYFDVRWAHRQVESVTVDGGAWPRRQPLSGEVAVQRGKYVRPALGRTSALDEYDAPPKPVEINVSRRQSSRGGRASQFRGHYLIKWERQLSRFRLRWRVFPHPSIDRLARESAAS